MSFERQQAQCCVQCGCKSKGCNDSFSQIIWLSVTTSSLHNLFLNKFNFVAIRVFHESNYSCAMFHWAGFSCDPASQLFNFFTGFMGIIHFNGNMPEPPSEIITVGIPIMSQFQNSAFCFILVADKRQCKLSFRIIFATQDPHSKYLGIKPD